MIAEPLKVVFDTNILISGHFWKGPRYRCVLAVEAGLAALILSDPILTEFREKLTDKFGVPKSEVDPIVERWGTRANVIPIEGKSGWFHSRGVAHVHASVGREARADPKLHARLD